MNNADFDEVEGQPNGVRIESTLAVVSNILASFDFAQEVVKHNGWEISGPPSQFQHTVAILFLASRFQRAVDTLSRQTATLKNQVDALSASGFGDR